jgi:tetratricopeptide (TPR) repeat protein
MRPTAFAQTVTWLVGFLVVGCAHDIHQQRADAIKEHSRAFYEYLQADRVPAAIGENERIEALAIDLGEQIRARRQQPGANRVDREWAMLKTAKSAAAENWLALAKYLTRKERYEQARRTYQRILDTYGDPLYRTYTEQAELGLRDLNILSAPSAKP